jgi:pimeloyl-ACP methyl ester carboxylesterase
VYYEIKDKKYYAQPYFITECYKNGPALNSNVNKSGDGKMTYAHINDDTASYFSRSFLIRFCEEEIELNEICHFQAEIEALPNFAATTFYLVIELIHSTYSNIGAKPDKNSDQGNVQVEQKSLETFKAKVTLSKTTVHEYVPIIFDNMNFSILNATLHFLVLDFRFRVDDSHLMVSAKDNENEKIDLLLNDNARSNGNLNNPNFRGRNMDDLDKSSSRTFPEYLKKHFKTITYDKLSEHFTNLLKENYERLLTQYGDLANKCLMESHKKKFSSLLQPPMKLILPDIWKSNDNEDNMKDKEKDLDLLANAVLSEINFISGELLYLWFKFMELLKITPRFILEVLKYDYSKRMKERWSDSFLRQIVRSPDFSTSTTSKLGEKHMQIAHKKRKNTNAENFEPIHCDDINNRPPPENQPILFEHIYVRETKENLTDTTEIDSSFLDSEASSYKGIHLIILVHGFQGNSFDMKLIKNNLSMLHPEALILCSAANEDNTENDISDMGLKLASEIQAYITETCPSSFIGRISFVGYSLGGLIIRACLPHLEQYADKMYSYFSLSSPHLGYMYNASKIIEAGMWFLKKWKKSLSLTQLSLADTANPEDSFLFKLSMAPGLNWFKNIAFVSSWQDQYAPFESARIEVCKEALSDSTKGTFYRRMTKNILGGLSTNNLYRIDVNFKINESNLDTMIGRAAHIRFLESQPLIRMLLYRYENFFS